MEKQFSKNDEILFFFFKPNGKKYSKLYLILFYENGEGLLLPKNLTFLVVLVLFPKAFGFSDLNIEE